jgi:hypothetical protein
MPAFRPLAALRCMWGLVVARTIVDVLVELASQPAQARAAILGLILVWLEGDAELVKRFPSDGEDC